MAKSPKLTAEARFAQVKSRDKEALKEREKANRDRSDKVDRLRALRLAKEAAETEAAARAKAEAPASTRKHRKKEKEKETVEQV